MVKVLLDLFLVLFNTEQIAHKAGTIPDQAEPQVEATLPSQPGLDGRTIDAVLELDVNSQRLVLLLLDFLWKRSFNFRIEESCNHAYATGPVEGGLVFYQHLYLDKTVEDLELGHLYGENEWMQF